MMILSFTVIGLMLVLIQTTVCMPSPVWALPPDLYYVLVAYLAYRLDLVRSLIILFPLVLTLDVLSGTVLGAYALLCYCGYFLLRFISRKLPISESLYQIPLIALSYLAVSWVVSMVLGLLQPGQLVPWSWWKMLARTGLVAAFAYPMFFLFDLAYKFSQRNLLPWNKLRLRTDNRRRRQT